MRRVYILAVVVLAACSNASDSVMSTGGPADPPPESVGPPESAGPPPQSPAQPPVTVALVIETTGAGGMGIVADQTSIAHTSHAPRIFIYPQGTTVTLTAHPLNGAQLQSWSGACSGTAPNCVLTLTEPSTTVGALFVPVPELPDPSPGTPYALRHVVVPDGPIRVTDVNAEGDVLGTVYYDALGDHYTPFIWHYTSGEVTYLELGDPPTRAEAVALNDRGAAVLREWTGHYWLYQDGQVRPILADRSIDVSDLGDQGWIVGGMGPEAMLYDSAGDILTLLGGYQEVVGVNGSGVMVGNSDGHAVVVGKDGSTTLLPNVGHRSIARGITEGGIAFGESWFIDPDTGLVEPAAGFLQCPKGDTTIIRPSADLPEIQMVAANDRGEAIVHGPQTPANSFRPEPQLWSRGTLTPVSALATFPSAIADAPAMNARGQIIVNYVDGGPRAAILTPRCPSDPGTPTGGPADPPPEPPPPPPPEYPLFVEVTGAGGFQASADQPGIRCGDTCTSYPQGTTVTLTATPTAGARLQSWGGACSGAPNACVLMLFETIYVALHFEPVPELPAPSTLPP